MGCHVIRAYHRTDFTNFWQVEELGIKHHHKVVLVKNDQKDFGATILLLQKAKHELGWDQKTTLKQLCQMIV